MVVDQAVRIPLPVGGVIARIRPEPQSEAHPLLGGLLHEKAKPIRKAFAILLPEIGIGRPIAVPHLLLAGERLALRVGGAALFPAIINLDHIHANLRTRLDLLQQKGLIDARIPVSASPRVGEQDTVTPRPVRPDRALERHHRALPSRIAAAIDQFNERIAVRQQGNASTSPVKDEVLHPLRPTGRHRRKADECQPVACQHIAAVQRAHRQRKARVIRHQQSFIHVHQVVADIGLIHADHTRRLNMLRTEFDAVTSIECRPKRLAILRQFPEVTVIVVHGLHGICPCPPGNHAGNARKQPEFRLATIGEDLHAQALHADRAPSSSLRRYRRLTVGSW